VSTTETAGESSTASPSSGEVAHRPAFVTTHWSVVLTAGRSETTRARDSLAKLCQTYWYPLYAYVRRRGYSSHDAQDLTQGFFAQLLERHSLASADPDRGRFRTFLLAAMNNFLASEREKARAKKRGGGCEMLSLDLAAAEQRYDLEPADDAATPDKAFDKQWALTLLSEVLNRLEEEYRREGKAGLFAALKQTLTGARESQPYAELSAGLGLNEGAIKVTVHRLRKRYRELIRAEIANTVASAGEINGEMGYLLEVLTGRWS
jgi:RNA polymerase sigma factor (sigma-70 family)